MVPFDVPAGTAGVRVKYCFDQPAGPTEGNARNTVDLGLWDPKGLPRLGRLEPPRRDGLDERLLLRGRVPRRPARRRARPHDARLPPGPVPAGRWEAELGVGGVVTREQGNPANAVAWRLEIAFLPTRRRAGLHARALRRRARAPSAGLVRRRPARPRRALGARATPRTARSSTTPSSRWRRAARGSTSSRSATTSRAQAGARSAACSRCIRATSSSAAPRSSPTAATRATTPPHHYVDHRLGLVFARAPDGTLTLRRGARPPSQLFDEVHRFGGWTQINHPRIFPSSVPAFRLLCRGCPWDYTDARDGPAQGRRDRGEHRPGDSVARPATPTPTRWPSRATRSPTTSTRWPSAATSRPSP